MECSSSKWCDVQCIRRCELQASKNEANNKDDKNDDPPRTQANEHAESHTTSYSIQKYGPHYSLGNDMRSTYPKTTRFLFAILSRTSHSICTQIACDEDATARALPFSIHGYLSPLIQSYLSSCAVLHLFLFIAMFDKLQSVYTNHSHVSLRPLGSKISAINSAVTWIHRRCVSQDILGPLSMPTTFK
jgi:hypothetical protein